MKTPALLLKQRIDNNLKELQEVCDELINPVLKMLNLLIDKNVPNDKMNKWLDNMDSVIIIIEEYLDIIEREKNKQ